jgi:poly(3-hydroxybutyrate) depolymerase
MSYRLAAELSDCIAAVAPVAGTMASIPSKQPPVGFIGKSTKNISAIELIWEFFEKHLMK